MKAWQFYLGLIVVAGALVLGIVLMNKTTSECEKSGGFLVGPRFNKHCLMRSDKLSAVQWDNTR